VINGIVEAMVSIRRIREYLSLPAMDRSAYFMSAPASDYCPDSAPDGIDISLMDATFAAVTPPANEEGETATGETAASESVFRLEKLTLNVHAGEFVGVVGKVGSGKSLLLTALLGEIQKESGRFTICF
jgi:ABC-type multidrug transport system fused ATPase/permease subunit